MRPTRSLLPLLLSSPIGALGALVLIGFVAMALLAPQLAPYDPEKDVVFYTGVEDDVSIKMFPGRFAVLYPEDVHRPNCDLHGTSQVKKICVKVRLKTQDGNMKGSRWTIQ